MERTNTPMDDIVTAKHESLLERQKKTPLAAVVALAEMQQRPSPILNIVTGGETVTVIGQIAYAEIYDPVGAALRYTRAGVDAISFFTDSQLYTSGLEDLLLVSRATSVPIILQDYILNGYHVAEARAAGASALTLYTSILDDQALHNTVSLTQRWRMAAILQIQTEADLRYVRELSPHVVAVGTPRTTDTGNDLTLLHHLRSQITYNVHCMLLDCLQTLDEVYAAVEMGVDAIIVDDRILAHKDLTNKMMEYIRSHKTPRFALTPNGK